MKEKMIKNKNVLLIIGIIGTVLLVLGVTYAYWILTKQQTGENVVNTACLNVIIEDEKNDISLQKTYPLSDDEGERLKPYSFSITNECDDLATYQINLESLTKVAETERIGADYLKVKLNEVGQEGIEKVLGKTSPTDTTIENTYEAHKLLTGFIDGGDTKNFQLRLWINGDTTVEDAIMKKKFISKISVTSTNYPEDQMPPTGSLALSVCADTITATATGSAYKNKSITKYEYNVDDNGWNVGNANQEFTEELGDHTIKLRVTDNKGIVSEEVERSITIVQPEMVDVYGMQIPVATCQNGLYKVEHNNLTQIGSEWGQTEYRFAGINYLNNKKSYVHNYIEFNDEKWQIIGLVNVKTNEGAIDQRLKIVRTEGNGQIEFGNYSRDSENSDWATSTLKDMLNGIYYDGTSGDCYKGTIESRPEKTTCDVSGNGSEPRGILNSFSKSIIDNEVIWNLGASNSTSLSNSDVYYELERRNIGGPNGGPIEWTMSNDETYHKGIGLMYPTDYGYSIGGEAREKCLLKDLYDYNEDNCQNNSWIYNNQYTWLLTPFEMQYMIANHITSKGGVHQDGFSNVAYKVLPTVYIKKGAKITDGDGSYNNPYQITEFT